MHCNSENYESDELHEIDVIDPKKYRAWAKKNRDKDSDALESYYDYIQSYFRWKLKNHKLIYFVFKPILCFLHFYIIKNIILKKNYFALIALLSEASAMFFVTLYFGLPISLFVCIGFAGLYTLIYYFKTIFRYYDYDTEKSNFNFEKIQTPQGEIQLTIEERQALEEINQKSGEQIYMSDFKQTTGTSYIINFIKKNYIVIIAFLFESAAITFTALYFSLQISLFVFLGFSLFYTLIYATRKILSCCEPKISNYVELDDNNDSASVGSNEEEIPLIKNDLQEDKSNCSQNNF